MEDRRLIELILEHDENAFRQLVERYQNIVFNVCLKFVHNKDDAEDLAQEVFVEVYRSLKKFRKESKLSTWLYKISVNKSLNFINSKKRKGIINSIESFFDKDEDSELIIVDERDESVEDEIDNQFRRKVLQNAIDSLPKNQKIAFSLSKQKDLSYKEISSVMDLSKSSVESLIHRAKMNLQKKLIKYYQKNYK